MLISIVTFRLSRPWTVEEAASVFRTTAPKYLGKRGLRRKHYYVTEAGDRAGGIYLWESKAAAQACYTPEWIAAVTEKYGAPPEFLFLESPVCVDNVKGVIEDT
jgi:hypothetical protein